MEREGIDIYLFSETWDEGNYVKVIRGYTMFHHNNEEKRRRQGVAIILSPRFTKAWKDAGGHHSLEQIRPQRTLVNFWLLNQVEHTKPTIFTMKNP
jgi:hypothetical protein